MSSPSVKPVLSVILLAPYGLDKLQDILDVLKVQTIVEQIQLVIATQPGARLVAISLPKLSRRRFSDL